MAKILKEHVFGNVSPYPWHKWLDGRVWQMTKGGDFKCSVGSFKHTATIHARKKGGRLRCHIKDKTKIVIQFYTETNR